MQRDKKEPANVVLGRHGHRLGIQVIHVHKPNGMAPAGTVRGRHGHPRRSPGGIHRDMQGMSQFVVAPAGTIPAHLGHHHPNHGFSS